VLHEVAAALTARGLGSAENDDCAGHAQAGGACWAWVIDGGTKIADRDYLGAPTGDVAWFSHALTAAFETLVGETADPRALHAAAAADVAQLYAAALARTGEAPPLYARPIAALILARIEDGRAQIFQLADCSAFAWSLSGAVRRLTAGEDHDEPVGATARVAQVQAQVGLDPAAVWRERLPALRLGREAQLRADPLQISTPAADRRFGGVALSVDLGGVEALVLMSDGFERYAAKYGLGDEAQMIRRIVTEGPDAVLADIRALERADDDCRRFPRLKPSDDATCLVLRRR
jgi:hypothetical protein